MEAASLGVVGAGLSDRLCSCPHDRQKTGVAGAAAKRGSNLLRLLGPVDKRR